MRSSPAFLILSSGRPDELAYPGFDGVRQASGPAGFCMPEKIGNRGKEEPIDLTLTEHFTARAQIIWGFQK